MVLSVTLHRAAAHGVKLRHACPRTQQVNVRSIRRRTPSPAEATHQGQASIHSGDDSQSRALTEAQKAAKLRRKLFFLNLEYGFYFLVLCAVQFFLMVAPNIYVNTGDGQMTMTNYVLKCLARPLATVSGFCVGSYMNCADIYRAVRCIYLFLLPLELAGMLSRVGQTRWREQDTQ